MNDLIKTTESGGMSNPLIGLLLGPIVGAAQRIVGSALAKMMLWGGFGLSVVLYCAQSIQLPSWMLPAVVGITGAVVLQVVIWRGKLI